MAWISGSNYNIGSGGAAQPPIDFTVGSDGVYDPGDGSNVYNNPALGGVGGKYSFFLSGQYQPRNTWAVTATGMVLLFEQTFQAGQTGSFIFY